MFPKAALTFLVVGALSVNALTIPVVQRSPAPEPEFQELEAWMLKRDLAYDLFSREPMDWDYMGKREPSPGGGNTPVPPYPNPPSPRPASPEPGMPGPAPRPLPPNHLRELDKLFSRESMDWDYAAKREPSPGGNTPVPPYPNPSSPRPASPEPGKPGPVPRPLPPNHL